MRSKVVARRGKRWIPYALALALGAGLEAQCTQMPNTGCGIGGGRCIGTTGVGQQFSPFCDIGGFFYVALGLCARAPITVPVGIMCSTPCNFGVDPVLDVLVVHGIGLLTIPSNPGLVGVTLCFQCVPFPIGGQNCFQYLGPAVRFTITP